uniref:Uncharacterized protein n=1 Tax=Arion vulgaris TaxID=1028688 RepID=A0A0B7A0E4_9EUPU
MVHFWNKHLAIGSILLQSCCVFMPLWTTAVPVSAVTSSESLHYLIKYGYLEGQDPKTGALRSEDSFIQALKQFQTMAIFQSLVNLITTLK